MGRVPFSAGERQSDVVAAEAAAGDGGQRHVRRRIRRGARAAGEEIYGLGFVLSVHRVNTVFIIVNTVFRVQCGV